MGHLRRGFTLVELTIVVMILTIVAAALSFGPPTAESQRKVDLAAEQVAMALRYARSEAIRAGEPRKVTVRRHQDFLPGSQSGTVTTTSFLTSTRSLSG